MKYRENPQRIMQKQNVHSTHNLTTYDVYFLPA